MDHRACRTCQAEIPEDAPLGLCPGCLMGLGLPGDAPAAPDARRGVEAHPDPHEGSRGGPGPIAGPAASTGRQITPAFQMLGGETPGRLFELSRHSMVVGRHPACDIVLRDETVSQKHALIVRGRDGVRIEDLKSHNGTFVDGRKVTGPTRLRDGQTIRFGRVALVFKSRIVEIREEDDSSRIANAIDVTAEVGSRPPGVRPEAKLRAMLEIGRALGATLDLQSILEEALGALFQIFPQADRGFVLLEDQAGNLAPKAFKTRRGPAQKPTISRTILEHVVNQGQAIFSEDTRVDARFGAAPSITDSIRTMMCVPLLGAKREATGLIQVDSGGACGRFDQEDLDVLVAVAGPVGVAVQNARLHRELVRQAALEQGLRHAREVQEALLPRRRPALSGYEFWDYYKPAHLVGGDYFGYFPIARPGGPPRWAVALADVMGKGMPAALLMARLSAEVRLLLTEPDPARVVERLNRELHDAELGERFVTFLLILLDGEDHRLAVVNAGHMPPMIRRSGGQIEEVGPGRSGFPLALFPDSPYETDTTTLAPGDVVLLYTDGLSEAMSPGDEPFTSDRVRRALSAAPESIPLVGDSLLRAVSDHAADQAQADDLTLVCFGRER